MGARGWIPVCMEMPDADETVMAFSPGDDEPVWPAYWDGECWMGVCGAPLKHRVVCWQPLPEPPAAYVEAI